MRSERKAAKNEQAKKQRASNESLTPLIREGLDHLLDFIVSEEKKNYNNPLVPFDQVAEKIKIKCLSNAEQVYHQLNSAKKILKEKLELEESEHPEIAFDSTFHSLEEAYKRLAKSARAQDVKSDENFGKKPLQEFGNISWGFMDRCYHVGEQLMEEKRFQEAGFVFTFLRYLNPLVFEYWFQEAICLHETEKYENAITSYGMSLMLQPQNPAVFFQMASALYSLQEDQACLQTLDLALKYAKDNSGYEDLYRKAFKIKEMLSTKKVA
jgi:tetratricopeptide (TPR) repeat protein